MTHGDPLPALSATDDRTLRQAQDELRLKIFDKGGHCPCCGQFAKIYKRRINASMARWAIALYQAMSSKNDGAKPGADGWVHVSRLQFYVRGAPLRSGDYGKLRFWGLVEDQPHGDKESPDKRRSGYWRLTKLGVDFVLCQHKVTRHALVYNDQLVGFEGPDQTIADCLGKGFSYQEIMESVGQPSLTPEEIA